MRLKKRLMPYYQAIPKLLFFLFFGSLFRVGGGWGLSVLTNLLIGSTGKASISSGDFAFVFTSWQGYVLLLLVLLAVLMYVAVEVNAFIIFCGSIVDGKKPLLGKSIIGGIKALKNYAGLRGIIVILFATVISPIIGLGLTISLTRNLYIPNFIRSVIDANPLTRYALLALLACLFIVSIIYCMMLPGVLLDGKKMKQAGIDSRRLVFKNLKNFLPELLLFAASITVLFILIIVVFIGLPIAVVNSIPMDTQLNIFLSAFFISLGSVLLYYFNALFSSFWVMKIIMLYRKYSSETGWSYTPREKKHHPVIISAVVILLLSVTALAAVSTYFFDELYPSDINTGIVAHRAGGEEAPENTVKGIEAAVGLGANGAEIDIQRTKDGYYIVNHDDTFARVAGDSRKPSEMTLAEVKKLRVGGEPVPTLEEMLEACRGKLTLFVELKGSTADERMADDAVRIINKAGMQDETVLISLKYDVLEYIEKKYPEVKTGYLTFFSFGNLEKLPFDCLAIEEEIASDAAIDAIHEHNKTVLIWTVNRSDEIETFLQSDADYIITDRVKYSKETTSMLESRTPVELMLDQLTALFLG